MNWSASVVITAIKCWMLLLQEAGLKHDTTAVDFAIYLLWVIGQADALNFGATLDNHR